MTTSSTSPTLQDHSSSQVALSTQPSDSKFCSLPPSCAASGLEGIMATAVPSPVSGSILMASLHPAPTLVESQCQTSPYSPPSFGLPSFSSQDSHWYEDPVTPLREKPYPPESHIIFYFHCFQTGKHACTRQAVGFGSLPHHPGHLAILS